MENRIYLRALELDDYKVSYKWRNDPDIQNMVGGPNFFVSLEKEKKWVEAAINDNNRIVLAICLKSNDKYIGNIMLQEIDWINRTAHLPILIGDKEAWGKGYGTEARMMMLKFAFDQRGLQRIFALVLDTNEASIKLHEKCGYVKEGVLRKAVYKNGRFCNQIIMAVLKEDFEKAYLEYSKKVCEVLTK